MAAGNFSSYLYDDVKRRFDVPHCNPAAHWPVRLQSLSACLTGFSRTQLRERRMFLADAGTKSA